MNLGPSQPSIKKVFTKLNSYIKPLAVFFFLAKDPMFCCKNKSSSVYKMSEL